MALHRESNRGVGKAIGSVSRGGSDSSAVFGAAFRKSSVSVIRPVSRGTTRLGLIWSAKFGSSDFVFTSIGSNDAGGAGVAATVAGVADGLLAGSAAAT